MRHPGLQFFRIVLLSAVVLGVHAPAIAAATIDTAPGPDISPYVISDANEPHLSHEQLLAHLRAHIKYVFVLYQENRSFDSYFGTFPGANGLFSQPQDQTPGFNQSLNDTDGSAMPIVARPTGFARARE